MPAIGFLHRLLMPLRGVDAAVIDRACRLADAKGVEVTVHELEALHRSGIDPSAVVQAKSALIDQPRVTIADLARMALAKQDLATVVRAFRDQPGLDPERWLIAQVGAGQAVLAGQRAQGISSAGEHSGGRWVKLVVLAVITIAIVVGVRAWLLSLRDRIDRRHDQINAGKRSTDDETDAPSAGSTPGEGARQAADGE